mmetsp:Transcript_53148/g.154759  ORF Transcript_53148/g.154759 Transcript_53148/m.154759 type:complete len:269 (-) Transcript_53148:66-872(-)
MLSDGVAMARYSAMQSSPHQTICFGRFLHSKLATSSTRKSSLTDNTLKTPDSLKQARRPAGLTANATYGPSSRPRSRQSCRSTSSTGPSAVPTTTWISPESSLEGGSTQMHSGVFVTPLSSARRWQASPDRMTEALTKRRCFRVNNATPFGHSAVSTAPPSEAMRSSTVKALSCSHITEKVRTTPFSNTQNKRSWELQPIATKPVCAHGVDAINRPAEVQVCSSGRTSPRRGWKTCSFRTVATGPPYGAPATKDRCSLSGSSPQWVAV